MALIQLNINRWGQGCCVLCERRVGRFITEAGISPMASRPRDQCASLDKHPLRPLRPLAGCARIPRSHRWLCLEPETRDRERQGETPLRHTHTPRDGEPELEGDREKQREKDMQRDAKDLERQ